MDHWIYDDLSNYYPALNGNCMEVYQLLVLSWDNSELDLQQAGAASWSEP